MKVDLEKAYDKVNWNILVHTLHLLNFPLATMKLISACISTSHMAILWNGNPISKFHPTRGLRQGGPLLPFFFVLYLEHLSSMIETTV